MATKEELEARNKELEAELEEARRLAAMEQNVWDRNVPSPKENRDRVQKRKQYEQAAVSSLVGAQEDASSVASSVDEDLQKELEQLRKENEELKASSEKNEDEKKSEDKPAAKKTAEKKNFS